MLKFTLFTLPDFKEWLQFHLGVPICTTLCWRKTLNSRISNNSLVLAQFFNSQSNWKTGGNLKLKERKEIGATFKRIGKTVSLLPPHFKTTPFSVQKDFFCWKLIEFITQKKTPACIILLKILPAKKNLFQSSEKIFLFKEKKWLNYSLWEKKTKRKKDSSRKRNQKKRVDIFPFMRLYSTTCWTLLQWTRKRKGFTGVKSKQISRLSKSFQK